MSQTHDQDFKNLIVDIPYQKGAACAGVKGLKQISRKRAAAKKRACPNTGRLG